MRHRVYGKHLGRNKNERKNLFQGLVYSLITYGTIQTSETKAKAIKGLVDKVINLAKDKKTQEKFQSIVTDKILQNRLTGEIIPKLGTRVSGYTKTVKIGTRLGDQTTMVRMSLIGAEDLKPIKTEKVSRGERVPQVSQGKDKKQVEKPRGTRDTSKTRGTTAKRRAVKK